MEYNYQLLKDCDKTQIEQWENEWYDSVERYIDYRFSNKTAEQSQQDYIQKRYKNRFKEARLRKETQTHTRKLARLLNSKKYKEILKRHYNRLDKANYNERLQYTIKLKDDIEEKKFFLINEISAQLKNEGKNPNHVNTKRGIIQRANKIIVNEFGIHPDNIENKSTKELEKILFADYEPQKESVNEDTWYWDIPDEKLNPIERLAKHDPVKYMATMQRLEQYKEAKRNGRLGMFQDSYGVYQF